MFYFITSENNISYVSGGVTNTTELILTGLSPEIGYSIFVVAFGIAYPVHTVKQCCFLLVSLRNFNPLHNNIHCIIGVNISFWSSGFSLERSREYSIIVIFNVIAGLSIESLNITVRDPSDEFRNSTTVEMPVGGKSYTMRIVFDSVRLSN